MNVCSLESTIPQGLDPRKRFLPKSPLLYLTVIAAWVGALAWFHQRMWTLTEAAEGPVATASVVYFIVFAEIAWLYGLYNLAIVLFARIYRREKSDLEATPIEATPPVAVLYTTCNDFVERSAESCVALEYPEFKVYILDDSSDETVRSRIDRFAARHPDRVTVVRRPHRRGFKAGNLNHALTHVATEPLFAVVDADELLPQSFLRELTPRLLSNPRCGFVQANHRCNTVGVSNLARDMGVGVDIHWKWYQPLRNRYGFVMFLGHGALLRRSCWEEVGGFPEIVSEDLAYAIAIREKGYKGLFAEDVVCLEEFPESVRAFRIRHVKWTRGTCEFLRHWAARLVRSREITWAEKLDILFPTLNLPTTFFFFLFMINAQFLFPFVLGSRRELTVVLGGTEFALPMIGFREEMNALFGLDFFLVTLLTILGPILCFIIALRRQPVRLFRFLCHSTALYAALSPLSFVSVAGFAATGKARFLVTGDSVGDGGRGSRGRAEGNRIERWLAETHPDSGAVRAFEFAMGALFLCCAIIGAQIGFVGLALAFLLLPLMHSVEWDARFVRVAVFLPFSILAIGVAIGSLGVAGLTPVFFGYGFHF